MLINSGNNTDFDTTIRAAAARWEQIITGDLTPVPGGTKNWLARSGNYTGPVKDIVIAYNFSHIDGPGGVLGNAGPLYFRPNTNLPISGMIKLDGNDLATMNASGTLQNVLIHEMGHALGLGTAWTRAKCINCTLPFTNNSFVYSCPAANAAFKRLNLAPTVQLRLESEGGPGTRCVHWAKASLGTEISTGYAYPKMPISIVTVGALEDLGYIVNYSAADAYTATTQSLASLLIGNKIN
jgi:hypothetical protein